MSNKLTKADVLAKAVRVYYEKNPRATTVDELPMFEALVAYEAAPAESQAAGDWMLDAAEEIILWKAENPTVTNSYSLRDIIAKHAPRDQSQQLAAESLRTAQARIAYLEKCEAVLMSAEKRARQADASLGALRERVAVLEKALADIIQKCGEDYDERDPFDDIQRIALAARSASGSQPSREKQV